MEKETERIGAIIKQNIESEFPGLKVYYNDRVNGGNKRVTPKLESTERNPKSRYQSLAWVDIGVIDPLTRKVVLLIEVEEDQVTPKEVIGDLCNIFFADRVQVGENDYKIDDVRLLLALMKNDQHDDRHKAIIESIDGVIARSIGEIFKWKSKTLKTHLAMEEYLLNEASITCSKS